MKPSSALCTREYIERMLAAIKRIRDYTTSVTLETFQATPMIIDAVVRNLAIVGEAARRVKVDDAAFTATHPEIPWQEMDAMRERVTHEYFNINAEMIWITVQRDLPDLEHKLANLKRS